MFKDDKIGIGWGRFVPMDFSAFGSFDGKNFKLDEVRLAKEFNAVSNAGANFVRIFPDLQGVWGKYPGGKKARFQPYILDVAKDNWRLGVFNDYFFPIACRVFEIANGAGLTVMDDWFENCEFHGAYIKWSFWANNVQGIQRFWEPRADKYTKPWILERLSQFKRYDMIHSFGNEIIHPDIPAFVKRVVVPIIRSEKLDFRRLTYGADLALYPYEGNHVYVRPEKRSVQDLLQGMFQDEFGIKAKMAVIRDVHTCGGPCDPKDKQRPYGATLDQAIYTNKPAVRLLVSDDGVYNGDSKCDFDVWAGKKRYRPSAATWGAMVKYTLGLHPNVSFEHIPHGPDLNCHVATIKAISAAYRVRFGVWPTNYGKHS